MSNIHQIRLFISTDCETCKQIIDYVQAWAQQHPTVQIDILSVLEHPVEVVRHQIFYTPALVIDGQTVSEQNLTVDRIAEILRNGV